MMNFCFFRHLLILIVICASSIISVDTCQINWNGNNWALGCDFSNNDFSQAQIPGEQCGGRCANTPECTHFSWSLWSGGTCFLKNGNVNKADALCNGDNSMVCGVIRESPLNPGTMSGTTTRYWDCCKPSCAWPGKADISNPVKTCQNDGFSQIFDANAQSGCNGGSAYTCNNNVPWAVNDQLAYGFAAANIQGSNEQGWCCACYKLDFTSGPVTGKSMIVQVTNTGGDLGNNHFDLQIPGGGVGLFDGCTPQWGLPTSVWGNQYGGVTSRDACGSLPQAIQSGCYFRFDWFQGADNPSMTFSKVDCPAELESRTQCTRHN